MEASEVLSHLNEVQGHAPVGLSLDERAAIGTSLLQLRRNGKFLCVTLWGKVGEGGEGGCVCGVWIGERGGAPQIQGVGKDYLIAHGWGGAIDLSFPKSSFYRCCVGVWCVMGWCQCWWGRRCQLVLVAQSGRADVAATSHTVC
jgi:hypothetical protein